MSYQVMNYYDTIWSLVIYGNGDVDAKTAAKTSECSKFFHQISISSDIAKCYWKSGVVKYFNYFYEEDLLNKVQMTFREVFFSYSLKMMNLLDKCAEQKTYGEIYNLLNPLIKYLSEPYANSHAQYHLAYSLSLDGYDYNMNLQDSVKFYHLSADQGFLKAEERLGSIYERGEQNQPQNYNLAFKYYKLAADHRIQDISKKLEINPFIEIGISQLVSLKDARENFLKSQAGLGCDKKLLLAAARYHEEGIGTIMDLKTAAKYYRVVANAKYFLWDRTIIKVAALYEKGIGTAKDLSQAIKYYKVCIKNTNLASSNLKS